MSTRLPRRPEPPAEKSGETGSNGSAPYGAGPSSSAIPSVSGTSGPSAGTASTTATVEPPILPPPSRKVLTMKKPMRAGEFAIEKSIQGVAFISLLFIALIFIFIFREAIPLFFSEVKAAMHQSQVEEAETYGVDPTAPEIVEAPELEQNQDNFHPKTLVSKNWQPVSLNPQYGIVPLLMGSLKVTLVALLLAAPIGIFAALYTSNFAPKWAKESMKPIIEVLAGFPSVVIGFFALVIMATLLQNLFGYQFRLNAFVGGVAMALAVIPIIYTVSEDALNAVPKVMTEASLALGATKWETAFFVILPSATPGIFAAMILGFGRAFGETMIVLMATGNAALLTIALTDPVRTLSATIGAEMAEVVFGDTHYRVLFFVGALLFVISFSLNAIAEFFIRNRMMKKFKGI
ncbi:MAG: phosphate ABC transporter permease subunit PstC [Fibrobacteria bacterium]